MGSTTEQLCRLCLQPSDDVVNIWDTFLDSTIASVLAKHFWFQVNKDDGLTEYICEHCWIQTKTFNEFYREVEQFQKYFWDSIGKVKSAQDPTFHHDSKVVALDLEPDLSIVKCEEVEIEVKSETTQLLLSSSEYREDNISDESETEQAADDENQCSSSAQNNEDDDHVLRCNVKKNKRLSSSEKLELDGQIRDLFNMNCDSCSDVKFKNLLEARRHYRKVHGKNGYITCCGKKFNQRADVVQHIRHHVNLTAHGPSEQMQQEAQIREMFAMKCEICSDVVEFVTLLEVRQHYRKVHKTRGYLTCCDKKFHRRIKMMDHIRWHTNSDTYSCNECGKRFPSKCVLKKHMDIHVPPDSRPFKCCLCPRSFVKKAALGVHVQHTHSTNNEAKYRCGECSKTFRTAWSLTSHIRHVHESTSEYVCEVCARVLKSKTALKQHINREHSTTPPPSPPPKVQCSICGAWLKRKELLSRHMKAHRDAQPVNCPVCNKMVQDVRLLDGHIRNAHGEKRHKCVMCEKAFKCAKNLKEHLAVHTGQDLYDCPYCEKKFKSNANMYSHRKKAHLTEWTRDNKAFK